MFVDIKSEYLDTHWIYSFVYGLIPPIIGYKDLLRVYGVSLLEVMNECDDTVIITDIAVKNDMTMQITKAHKAKGIWIG